MEKKSKNYKLAAIWQPIRAAMRSPFPDEDVGGLTLLGTGKSDGVSSNLDKCILPPKHILNEMEATGLGFGVLSANWGTPGWGVCAWAPGSCASLGFKKKVLVFNLPLGRPQEIGGL